MKNLLYFTLVVLVLAMVSSAFGTAGGGHKDCVYEDGEIVNDAYFCERTWPFSDYCPSFKEYKNDSCVPSSWWPHDDCTTTTPDPNSTKKIVYNYDVLYTYNYAGFVCQVNGVWTECGEGDCGGVGINCYSVSISDCGCKAKPHPDTYTITGNRKVCEPGV